MMSANFCSLVNFLIAYSLAAACDLVLHDWDRTRETGLFALV